MNAPVRPGGKLTNEGEAALFLTGDRDAIVRQYMPYVKHMAQRWTRGRPGLFDDAVQQGSIGLLTAIERFDVSMGNRFTTYATHWINHTIRRFLDRTGRIVNVGKSSNHIVAIAGIRSGKITDAESLATEAKVSQRTANALFAILSRHDLSDRRSPEHGGEEWLTNGRTTEDEYARTEWTRVARERIDAALGTLTDRERDVIHRRFLAAETEGLSEAGAAHGLSKERARQIELQAIKKLRRALKPYAKDLAE